MAFEEEEDESQQQQQRKRTNTLPSSETLENLQSIHIFPSEIEFEILSRLPVESLLRCKSVCKLWRSLISDPHFVKYNLNLSNSNSEYAHHRLIIWPGRTSVRLCPLYDAIYDKSINALEFDYPSKHPRKAVWMVGSCNGLLCIYVMDNDVQVPEGTMFIWNPSTRRSIRLPCSGYKASFFPRYGFGYDECYDDYKVVSIVKDGAENSNRVIIYSLKSGNWKRIGDLPRCSCLDYFGKFSNGALHWVVSLDSSSPSSRTIISLDLAKETYGEVVQPVYDEGTKRLRLAVLGEWLCLLCDYTMIQKTDVWVKKDYGGKDSWTKLVTIQHPLDRFWVPLTITNDGKLLLCNAEKLVLYDVKNESLSEIINYDGGFVAHITVESLVSPDAPRN